MDKTTKNILIGAGLYLGAKHFGIIGNKNITGLGAVSSKRGRVLLKVGDKVSAFIRGYGKTTAIIDGIDTPDGKFRVGDSKNTLGSVFNKRLGIGDEVFMGELKKVEK